MAKKNSRVKRVNPKLVRDLDDVMNTRVHKKLMPIQEARFTKMTELLTRTQGYRMSLEELRFKPEKKKTNGNNKK